MCVYVHCLTLWTRLIPSYLEPYTRFTTRICLQATVSLLSTFFACSWCLPVSVFLVSVTLWCHREADTLGRVLTQWTPSSPGKGRVGEGGDCRVQTLATISHAHAGRVVSDFYNCVCCYKHRKSSHFSLQEERRRKKNKIPMI